MNNKKLKILIINYEYPPLGGGGGVATYDLAIEWAKTAQVDVLTSSFRGLDSFEIKENVNIHRVKVLFRKSRDAASFISMLTYLPAAIIKGYLLFKKNRYDVINTHFAVPSGPIGFILGKLFKVPNILSLHGGDIYDPSKKLSPHKNIFFKNVVKFVLNKADYIVAQSSNTRNNTIKYYKPDKPVLIIPLAFHPPEIKKTGRKELNIKKNEFVLVTIGRLVKRKAIDVAIKAISKTDNKNINLYVIGDGPEKGYLTELTIELGLEDRVHFPGFVNEEEKYNYLSNADIFILTSLHEGFGIVFMEAMHVGLPIVCANNGGQVDFLNNEENAILIDVGDISGCSEAIKKFNTDKVFYKKCSRNNVKKVKIFYAEKIAKKYLEIFNKEI